MPVISSARIKPEITRSGLLKRGRRVCVVVVAAVVVSVGDRRLRLPQCTSHMAAVTPQTHFAR
jgi:hypothetical protein